ncbi:MAG TPA: hypothetical protein VF765_14805 [Polyangiaceae bacterium]
MTSLRSLSFTLVLAGGVLAASPAAAQDASNKAAAEALFRDGRALYDQGKYPEACAKFAESQRLDPAPGTLLNLAGCYEKNGQTASAWATFKEAMAAAHVKGRTDWEDLARTRASALEPTLSRLTIAVASKADGLTVTRDGSNVGSAEWGTAIPVDPGSHAVDAQAPHRKPFHQPIDVPSGGANVTVTVAELDAADEGGGTPGTETPSNGSTQRTIGLVVGGLGIVGIGIGTAFGFSAMSKENDATQHHCDTTNHCDGTGVQLGHDAQSAATASTIAFAVGGVALAGGLLLYFTAPKGSSAPTVGLRATALPGGGAFGIQGAW